MPNWPNSALLLPAPAAPVAAYVPNGRGGRLPLRLGPSLVLSMARSIKGRLGEDVGAGARRDRRAGLRADAARAGARLRSARLTGSRDVVKLGAFIASTNGFTDQPKVADGASELMVAVFGEAGEHCRSAVGVPVLPLGCAVEIDAVFAVVSCLTAC